MSGTQAFKAVLTAEDLASVTIAKVGTRLKELGVEAHVAAHEIAHVENESVWARLGEHVGHARESFTELGASIGEAGAMLGEWLPALGGLAAVGSVGGVFELVAHASEGYAELAKGATELGVSTQQLHDWNIVANLAEINADTFAKSMNRLNITLADAARGKSKDAAALFKHLHIDPRSFHDSADALGPLADAFVHTQRATERATTAATLFGARAGKEMLPLLMQGSAGIVALQEKAKELGVNLEPYGRGLDDYNESMKELGVVTQGFTDELGGALAPILGPVVDEMRQWVQTNREWINTDIKDSVKGLADEIKNGDWESFGGTLRGWADDARDFAGGLSQTARLLDELANVHKRRTKDELRHDFIWQAGKSQADIDYDISMAPDTHDEPTPVKDFLKSHLPTWLTRLPDWMPREPQDAVNGMLSDDTPAAAARVSPSHTLQDQLAVNRHFFGTPFGAPPDGFNPATVNAARRKPSLAAAQSLQDAGGSNDLPRVSLDGYISPADRLYTNLRMDPISSLPPASAPRAMDAQQLLKGELKITFSNAPAGMTTAATASGNMTIRVEHDSTAFGDMYGQK